MIWIVLVGIGAAIALAFVIAPLRKDEGGRLDEDAPDAREELTARKRAALLGIVDVEEEARLGKLGDADVSQLTARYEAEALSALRALDSVPHVVTDDALEAEIAAVKERLTCPHCGAFRASGGRCESCGKS